MALVLTRIPGETIVTDGPVKIEVARVEGKHVVLRLTADKDVKILRGELFQLADAMLMERKRNPNENPHRPA